MAEDEHLLARIDERLKGITKEQERMDRETGDKFKVLGARFWQVILAVIVLAVTQFVQFITDGLGK